MFLDIALCARKRCIRRAIRIERNEYELFHTSLFRGVDERDRALTISHAKESPGCAVVTEVTVEITASTPLHAFARDGGP